MKLRRYPSTSSVTSKGQVTIPADIRRYLSVGPGDRVTFLVREGRVVILPGYSIAAATAGMLKSDVPPLRPREENDIFEQAMADEANKPLT